MCGIAGIVDLRQQRAVSQQSLARMAKSLVHRGPDEEGFYIGPASGLAARRLSIVDLADGQQPVFNEDQSIVAVFNGELFDYPELQEKLKQRGHRLRSHCDSELIVHLWEDFGEDMFSWLRGQFAFALLDIPKQRLVLARDRVGICPLHWSRQGDWLVFGSEIKALLASGLVPAAPDPKGLDNIFTFFCMPGRRTAFGGISSVLPGGYVRIDFGNAARAPALEERKYWDLNFPDRGEEEDSPNAEALVSAFDEKLGDAVRRRLRADVPIAAYLSGGVDSALVLAKCREAKSTPPTFTARMGERGLDESPLAQRTARDMGCEYHPVDCGQQTLIDAYPLVIRAADCPVVDPNAGAIHTLAGAVRRAGYKAVLTGEGADEALAGYIWFKGHRLLTGFPPAMWAAERYYHHSFRKAPKGEFKRINELLGGFHAQTMVYHFTSLPHWQLLRDDFRNRIGAETAYDQLAFDASRVKRWHPLNQSLYMGYKTMLPGLLLNHRGDRASMANSVEARYPFLDESVIEFCSRIHPHWKLRGLGGDKYLLRLAAGRLLPQDQAMRTKAMFRAPFGNTLLSGSVPYVAQLLSPESLQRTDYFDAARVAELLNRYRRTNPRWPLRIFHEMALCAVVATQLWHHIFLAGGLCDLPQWEPPAID